MIGIADIAVALRNATGSLELLRESRRDNSAHVAVMRHLRAAAIEMEAVMGGPVQIMHHMPTKDGAGFTVTFERVPGT